MMLLKRNIELVVSICLKWVFNVKDSTHNWPGQDASYLIEHCISKGYNVHTIVRRSSSPEYHTHRIDHIFDPESRTNVHYGDLSEGFDNIILAIKPDMIFNLAAQSHVWVSFKQPIYTAEVNAIGVLRLLESVKRCQQIIGKEIRFYQASSSELWEQLLLYKMKIV